MKKLLCLIFFIWSIPSLTHAQNINLTVFNKTGYDLDSVSFHHYNLGKIGKEDTIFLSDLNELVMQGNVPLHRPFGIIQGKKRPNNLKPCGTKSRKEKAGSYAFDLLIYENGEEYRFYWQKHE
jgi:hypothetical protein